MVLDVMLLPFNDSHIDLLRRWLSVPYVSRWYPQPQEHLDWAVNPPIGGDCAIIAVSNVPVGYVRWQAVSREVLDSVGLEEIPENSIDIDILIGEENYIGRGIGVQALRILCSRLRSETSAPLLGLSPSIHNHAAQRAYRKVGFRDLREYDAPGYGRCLLMVMDFFS
jgi:aminoglycoside 6'-N-acetyltransferase